MELCGGMEGLSEWKQRSNEYRNNRRWRLIAKRWMYIHASTLCIGEPALSEGAWVQLLRSEWGGQANRYIKQDAGNSAGSAGRLRYVEEQEVWQRRSPV